MTARLGHEVEGSLAGGPVLVLAPSLGTDRGLWAPQRAAFAQHFTVVALDHRGHGGSDVPEPPYSLADVAGDVLALLDELGVARFSFCGLSLGAMVGMWVASHAPDRVDRLALCCTSAHLPPAQTWLDRGAAVQAGGMTAVADAVVGRWFTPDFSRDAPLVVQECRQMLLSTPPLGYAGCCAAIAGMDLRPNLADIAAPTLVLAGQQDAATPPEHAEHLAGGIAGARLAVVEGCAHLAIRQRPEECTRLLLDHLCG